MSELKLINLTPHDIKVIGKNGKIQIIPKTGIIARVKNKNISPRPINEDFLSYRQITEEVIDLPEPSKDVLYIVSHVVLKSLYHRKDLIAPNTTKGANKDEEGNVESVKSFIRN